MLFAVEAGGTKFVLGAGPDPDDIIERVRIPTEDPAVTIPAILEVFDRFADQHGRPAAVGVASFGPIEVRPDHPHWGWITTTPKPGWSDTDLMGPLLDRYAVPGAFDTDVNGAALAEGSYGAALGAGIHVYLTFGTGVGGGLVVDGESVHGGGHPEMGHIRLPRHPDDDFVGICPYHGDCLEGMASGPAIEARWGKPGDRLGADLERAVAFEAHYIAHALADMVYIVAPERFVIGGGVAKLPGIHRATREKLAELLAGYPGLAEHADENFVVPPLLDDDAGLTGALMLAAAVR